MDLKNLISFLPSSEAIIRVYDHYLMLNATAVKLLGVDDSSIVAFRYDATAAASGRKRVYCGVDPTTYGFRAVKRQGRYAINSRKMAHILCEWLDGPGAYRICRDDYIENQGVRYYNIFFKRYD